MPSNRTVQSLELAERARRITKRADDPAKTMHQQYQQATGQHSMESLRASQDVVSRMVGGGFLHPYANESSPPKHCKDCVLVRIRRKDGHYQRYWVKPEVLESLQSAVRQGDIDEARILPTIEQYEQFTQSLESTPARYRYSTVRDWLGERFGNHWLRHFFMLLGAAEAKGMWTETGIAGLNIRLFSPPGAGKSTIIDAIRRGVAALELPYEVAVVGLSKATTPHDILGIPTIVEEKRDPNDPEVIASTKTAILQSIHESIQRAKQNGRRLLVVLEEFEMASPHIRNALASLLMYPGSEEPAFEGVPVQFVALANPNSYAAERAALAIEDRFADFSIYGEMGGFLGGKNPSLLERAESETESALGATGESLQDRIRRLTGAVKQVSSLKSVASNVVGYQPGAVPVGATIPITRQETEWFERHEVFDPDVGMRAELALAQNSNYERVMNAINEWANTSELAQKALAFASSRDAEGLQVQAHTVVDPSTGDPLYPRRLLTPRRLAIVAGVIARYLSAGYPMLHDGDYTSDPALTEIVHQALGSVFVDTDTAVDASYPLLQHLSERFEAMERASDETRILPLTEPVAREIAQSHAESWNQITDSLPLKTALDAYYRPLVQFARDQFVSDKEWNKIYQDDEKLDAYVAQYGVPMVQTALEAGFQTELHISEDGRALYGKEPHALVPNSLADTLLSLLWNHFDTTLENSPRSSMVNKYEHAQNEMRRLFDENLLNIAQGQTDVSSGGNLMGQVVKAREVIHQWESDPSAVSLEQLKDAAESIYHAGTVLTTLALLTPTYPPNQTSPTPLEYARDSIAGIRTATLARMLNAPQEKVNHFVESLRFGLQSTLNATPPKSDLSIHEMLFGGGIFSKPLMDTIGSLPESEQASVRRALQPVFALHAGSGVNWDAVLKGMVYSTHDA